MGPRPGIHHAFLRDRPDGGPRLWRLSGGSQRILHTAVSCGRRDLFCRNGGISVSEKTGGLRADGRRKVLRLINQLGAEFNVHGASFVLFCSKIQIKLAKPCIILNDTRRRHMFQEKSLSGATSSFREASAAAAAMAALVLGQAESFRPSRPSTCVSSFELISGVSMLSEA